MSALVSIYIKKETLKTLFETVEKKGEKGVALTISVDDNTNDYGQNVASWVEQTKEQREAKTPRYYVANGKVVWTNGSVVVAEKKDQPIVESDNDTGLPF